MTSRPDNEDDWRGAGLAFDRAARDYEHARPDYPDEVFELLRDRCGLTSATAFHWVDPAVGSPKAAEVLVDGGWLALWWTIFGDDERPDPFHEALKEILEIKAPELVDHGQVQPAYALDSVTRIGEIDETGLFGPIEQRIVRWEGRHDPIGMPSLLLERESFPRPVRRPLRRAPRRHRGPRPATASKGRSSAPTRRSST